MYLHELRNLFNILLQNALAREWRKEKGLINYLGHLFIDCWDDNSLEQGCKQNSGTSVFSQFSSVAQSCLTLCDLMDCTTPGFAVHHRLLELAQTQHPLSRWCHPTISHSLLSSSLPAFNLSQHQGLFQGVSSSHQVAKVDWSLSFSISPFHEYSGLISFRMDWLDLLTVQGTLKNLLQHHSSKASILGGSDSLKSNSHNAYMTTGKP